MAKKKQEQQEQSQDEHVMAVLDKRTNKTAVISKMNEQDGSIEVVPPDKKNNSSFLKLDRTTPLELFFTNFKNQYQNPTSFSFFLVPLVMLDKVLNAVIQIRKGEDPGPEGKKMVENCELNDEGRIAKLARRYKFDEHQLPWKDLNALGLDKETLFSNHGRTPQRQDHFHRLAHQQGDKRGEERFGRGLLHVREGCGRQGGTQDTHPYGQTPI